MILISRTYQVVTPESAEDGDFAETGFDYEDAPHNFRELIDMLEEHRNCSCYPVTDTPYTWFSSSGDIDMYDGSETTYSIHYSRNNLPRSEKYWRKAIDYVFGNSK